MKRSDIKPGYLITESNGRILRVVRDINHKLKILDNFQLGGLIRTRYNENLTGSFGYNDIVKIQDENNKTLWERPTELTMQEIADKFGINIQYLRIKS